MLVITAGWRHDEADDSYVRAEIHPSGEALPFYRAFDRVVAVAPELTAAYRVSQQRIRRLKGLYRLRLGPALQVVRRLLPRLAEAPDLVGPDLEAALQAVREIDRQFLERSDAEHRAFDDAWRPLEHPEVARIRARAAQWLAEARGLVLGGGHVGVLRNRLAFFDLAPLVREAHADGMTVAGWSAGAMVLSSRIVLFHDDPPHGSGDPELFDRGLGLFDGMVMFPHAPQRLRLDDALRVAALAGRFRPDRSIGLDSGALLTNEGGAWETRGHEGSTLELCRDGVVRALPLGSLPPSPCDAFSGGGDDASDP